MKEAKQKKYLDYINVRFTENTVVIHDDLYKLFHYHSKYITDGSSLGVGFNLKKIRNVINDIINSTSYKLIGVSEDNNSITYHFLSETDTIPKIYATD